MRYFNTLRTHREAKQLSQWAVARDVDIQLTRYGRMEKGMTQPSYAEGVRLGALLGVDPAELFPVSADEHARAS